MTILSAIANLLAAGGDYLVSRSVRLRSSATAFFSRTPSTASNRKTWTWSGWVKRGALGEAFLFEAQSGTTFSRFGFDSGNLLHCNSGTSAVATTFSVTSNVAIRDPSAWYHFVLAFDTTQATAANRVRMYINGNQITSFLSASYPAQNSDWSWNNSGAAHNIGRYVDSTYGAGGYFDGYFAEVNFIDGQALTPSSFGETDTVTGVWKPKKYSGSFGTNGFYLNFSDNSAATAAAIGKDSSGNANHWTPNNIALPNAAPITITTAKIYAVYGGPGPLRTANFSVQYSDNNSSWTTAFSGQMSATGCGIFSGSVSGDGSYGAHRYWRYVVGTTIVGHHPRVSRIILGNAVGDTTIVTFTSDNCADSGTIPSDGSSYSYDFLASAVSYDSMIDTPTAYADGGTGRGNYAVINPLHPGGGTVSQGNLVFDVSASNVDQTRYATMAATGGKFYFEVRVGTAGSPYAGGIGVSNAPRSDGAAPDSYANGWAIHFDGNNVYKRTNNAVTTIYSGGTGNNIYMIAVDTIAGKIWMGRDGVWASGDPAAGTGEAFSGLSGDLVPYVRGYVVGGSWKLEANFGQRPFAYSPPAGFKAINSQNLPDPIIKQPNKWMDVSLWTGDNTANRTITNAGGFQPDLVWLKGRSTTWEPFIQDSVRGFTEYLRPSSTGAAGTTSPNIVTAAAANGFVIENNGNSNASGSTYVGWQWKRGATPGLDIVAYNGTGAAQNIAHSLGVAPKMFILKKRNTAATPGADFLVYHASLGPTVALKLNLTDATEAQSVWFNNTAPTASVFTVGSSNNSNISGGTYIAWLFSEVAGFSRFGGYTGNGSTDGPMIFTGFRPRWVMVKNTSAAGAWMIFDTARSATNATDDVLEANTSNAEAVNLTDNLIDTLSNGFKLRGNQSNGNASGNTYIYAAFAESPFKYALAR